jgi:hypothetical protein
MVILGLITIINRVDSVSMLSEQSPAHDTAKEDEAEESNTNKERSCSHNDASKKFQMM